LAACQGAATSACQFGGFGCGGGALQGKGVHGEFLEKIKKVS
jgi:hypothetical protein